MKTYRDAGESVNEKIAQIELILTGVHKAVADLRVIKVSNKSTA